MKKLFLLLAAAMAGTFSLPAAAQFDPGSAFYLGASVGHSHFVDVCNGQAGGCDDRDTAFGLLAGLQLNRYIGIEAGLRDFGHAELPSGNVKAKAWELDAVGTLPLYRGFSLIGRVGVFHGELNGENISEKKNGGTIGWGAQYDFSPQAAVRLEWQRYPSMGGGDFGSETDVDALALSVLMRFR